MVRPGAGCQVTVRKLEESPAASLPLLGASKKTGHIPYRFYPPTVRIQVSLQAHCT
jgi:hypothetical protein